MGVRIT